MTKTVKLCPECGQDMSKASMNNIIETCEFDNVMPEGEKIFKFQWHKKCFVNHHLREKTGSNEAIN